MSELEPGKDLSRLPENLGPARSECSPSIFDQDEGPVEPVDYSKLPEGLKPARSECSPSIFVGNGDILQANNNPQG